MITTVVRGHRAVRPGIDSSTLYKSTEKFADFIRGLVEAAWNERDAWKRELCGEFKFVIQYVRRGRKRTDLLLYGNGTGICDSGLTDIVCLNRSSSAGDPSKRGKVGTGSKAFCWHSTRLIVQTIRRGEATMLQLSYTPQELVEMWNQGEDVNWEEIEIPVDSPLVGHGTCFIWENLGQGERVNAHHDRSPERVVAELAQFLPADISPAITVIDEHGREHQLTPRKIRGDKIEGVTRMDHVGQIAYVIAVTEKRAKRDELALWAHDRVCTIGEFLRQVRPTSALAPLLDAVSVTLDHPHVVGQIALPEWNDFVDSDRDGWLQSLFDDEVRVFALLKWLYTDIVPLIDVKIGHDRSSVVSDNETMRNELVAAFQAVGGVPETKDVIDIGLDDPIEVSASRIQGEPGMRVDLAIQAPKSGITYIWDDSKSLGELSSRRGTQVTFTFGEELGHGEILVRGENKSARISTHVIARLPFGFVVASRHGEPGQRITHTLQHTHYLTGRPAWNLDAAGGHVQVAEDGLSAVHTLAEAESTYEVNVQGPVAGEMLSATCTIFVACKTDRPVRARKSARTEWLWDGQRYELAIRNYPPDEKGGQAASWVYEGVGERATSIVLNFAHPIFAGADPVRRTSAITQIALCISQDQLRRNPLACEGEEHGEWVRHRAAQIFARFIMGNKPLTD